MVNLAIFCKTTACGQTVLPDMPISIGQKLVENAKIKKKSNETFWVIFKQYAVRFYYHFYLNCTLGPTRGHPLPIRTEFETIDGFAVAFVGENAAFSANVPKFEIGVA